LTVTICLTIAVLLGSAGVSWSADYHKGITAYEGGDPATALRKRTPLAEQGYAATQSNQREMYANRKGLPQDDKPMLTLDKARHPLSVMQKLLEQVDRFLNSGLWRTPPKNRGTLSFVGTIINCVGYF
jgi:TPR repeat protein